ncbi:MAG: hypothetical protein AAB513_03485 [Patescibacteria group bacterium]
MKMQKNSGLVGLIILIVIAIFALSYFGISLRGIAESETGQENIGFVKEISIKVWDGFLRKPAEYLWNTIWLDLSWHPFVDTLKSLKAGRGTGIEPEIPDLTSTN